MVEILFFGFLSLPIALHGATPVVVSQATLTLMFVVVGVLLMGIGFGVLVKNKISLLQHRWAMTIVVGLTLTVIFLVMLPSAYSFYTDADLQLFSGLSILTLIHGLLGAPAITIGVMYAFGDLPQKVKYWMRWAAVFWAISLILGVLVFLDMLDLLSFPMTMQWAMLL
jgi:hypothetical protein